jgi:four helix bundle protein
MKSNAVLDLSFEFACDILDLYIILKEARHFEIGSQIVRSGTSIGANVREGQRAESKRDFNHKLKIALKEADETRYWLDLINEKLFEVDKELIRKNEDLIRLLVAITKSADTILRTK